MNAHTNLRFAWPFAAALLSCGGTPPPSPERVPEGNVVSRVDAVPAGADCPAGGKAARSGVDANGDGALQDVEVTSTQLVCFEAAKALLLRTDAELAGANCPSGGQAVRAGLDGNGNGNLDDAEVERVSYVCGKAPVAQPAVMTRKTALMSAAECVSEGSTAAGTGIRVQAGHDRDSDGALSDAEVEQTVVVCDPPAASPKPVLTRQDPAPYGACQGPGTLVRVGADANGDGALSDTEVSRTVTVCSDTLPTFTVASAADLALLAKATRIAGNLFIQGNELESVTVPAEVVDGWIVVDSNPKLTTASFSTYLVGGGIAIRHNPVLTSFDLRALYPDLQNIQHLAGLEIRDDPALEYVHGLDHVETIAGNLWVEASGLGLLSLDALTFVGGSVLIRANPGFLGWLQLRSTLPSVTVDGGVELIANPSWDYQYLPFKAIGESLTVADDGVGQVYVLFLHDLERVGGITLERNTKLVDISVPKLASIAGNLVLSDNAALFPSYGNTLRDIAGSVQVVRNAHARSLGMLAKVSQVSGSVTITDNPSLQYLWMPELTWAKGVTIARNDALSAIGPFDSFMFNFRDLATVGWLDVQANPSLAQLSLPFLSAADKLSVKDNAALPTCAALALAKQLKRAPIFTEISGNLGDGESCP